jgi:Ni/Co efflux regulator RcnB
MKRLILSLAALMAATGPLAATPAQAQGRWSREESWERREDHYERRDDYERRRWEGRNAEHNRRSEYYGNRRWSYPQPPGPSAYYGRPPPRSGYPSWRRGAYLPPMYRGEMIRDYPRYRLRAPPRGYTWYHVERDYMLTGPSGVIFDIVPGD